MNRLVARVDLDPILARVDMDDMIAADRSRRGDRAILWRSREQCARVVRSQAVGIDEFIARWVARSPALLHQPARPPDRSAGRGPIMTAFSGCAVAARTPAAAQESLQGRYAAFASRFAAYAVDAAASTVVFMLALAAISFAVSFVTGKSVSWNRDDTWAGIAYVAWLFIYFAYSWAASGKTFGMAVFGRAGCAVRRRRFRRAAGRGAHAGAPAELPDLRPRVRRDPAGPPAQGAA